MARKILQKWGQVFLGFVFTFIALLLLAVGFVRIWVWFTSNQAGRAYNYQVTRTDAGSGIIGKDNDYSNLLKPTQRPLELTKDWVFKGKATGKFAPIHMNWQDSAAIDPDQCCHQCCSGQAHTDSDSGYTYSLNCGASNEQKSTIPPGCSCLPVDTTTGNFTAGDCVAGTVNCTATDAYSDNSCVAADGSYDNTCPCFSRCKCRYKVGSSIGLLRTQASNLRCVANTMHTEANAVRDACGDIPLWSLCWWAGFGKLSGELQDAAGQMDGQGNSMSSYADTLDGGDGNHGYVEKFRDCCESADPATQDSCVRDLLNELDKSCITMAQGIESEWNGRIAKYNDNITKAQTEIAQTVNAVQNCVTDTQYYCRAHCLYKQNGAPWMLSTFNITIDDSYYVTANLTGEGEGLSALGTADSAKMGTYLPDSDACFTACMNNADLCCSWYNGGASNTDKGMTSSVNIIDGMAGGNPPSQWGDYCYNPHPSGQSGCTDATGNPVTCDLGPLTDPGTPPDTTGNPTDKSVTASLNDQIKTWQKKIAAMQANMGNLEPCCNSDLYADDKDNMVMNKMKCIGNLVKQVEQTQ